MFVPLRDATVDCGPKAAHLATLVCAGVRVPDGFVVLPDVDVRASSVISDLTERVRELGNPPLAVRSSSLLEDGAAMSAAGQLATTLGVRGVRELLTAIAQCRKSATSPGFASYRAAHAAGDAPTDVSVLIQRLIRADVSGVLFTPTTPNEVTIIESSFGLGAGVVGGQVTPDRTRVTVDGKVCCATATKATRVDLTEFAIETTTIAAPQSLRPSIDAPTARRLAALGNHIAHIFGGPQDVEWAIDAHGVIWVLQARPITAALPEVLAVPESSSTTMARETCLSGTPASAGTATGAARIVLSADDFHKLQPGDILVCPHTDPAWTPLLRVAAAVVTEVGGVLNHAAIVAREYGIPAILGVRGASTTLVDGAVITVDAGTGAVTTHT